MSATTPVTKSQVLSELQLYGISTNAQLQDLLAEPRQFEASAPALLPGESGGQTTMNNILADLAAMNNLQYVSRRQVRHLAKLLFAEGAL